MLVPLAPSQRRAPDRAASRTRGRRLARWAAGGLLITGALLAVGSAAMAATHATSAPPVSQNTAVQTTTAAQTPVHLTALVTPAAPGGVCQVPGIGDIGGLVGVCSSGAAGPGGGVEHI